MSDMERVGDSNYYLGIDWSAKKLGVPVWGWGAGLAYLAYRLFFKKRR